MNFDILDNDAPWINNAHSEDFNAESEAQKLISQIEERRDHYLHDEVLMLFGDDFRYMNAFQNYENMDAMISYMNENYGDKYNLFYSTPSVYVDAVAKYNISWPTKYDDMFPYSDNPDAYWTGYFSSRANDKGYIRRASSNYHASNQLYAEKVLDQSLDEKSLNDILAAKYQLLDDLGINQHHDAVTGTGKQAVANDYAHRLFTGMEQNNVQYSKMIDEKIKKMIGSSSE
jgi:lysosomal alpha-mannosidase